MATQVHIEKRIIEGQDGARYFLHWDDPNTGEHHCENAATRNRWSAKALQKLRWAEVNGFIDKDRERYLGKAEKESLDKYSKRASPIMPPVPDLIMPVSQALASTATVGFKDFYDRMRMMNLSLPWEPGIYFLWRNGSVVYVGSANSLGQRVNNDHKHVSPETSVSWLVCQEKDLNFWECYYIWLTESPLNCRIGDRSRHSPQKLSEIMSKLLII